MKHLISIVPRKQDINMYENLCQYKKEAIRYHDTVKFLIDTERELDVEREIELLLQPANNVIIKAYNDENKPTIAVRKWLLDGAYLSYHVEWERIDGSIKRHRISGPAYILRRTDGTFDKLCYLAGMQVPRFDEIKTFADAVNYIASNPDLTWVLLYLNDQGVFNFSQEEKENLQAFQLLK